MSTIIKSTVAGQAGELAPLRFAEITSGPNARSGSARSEEIIAQAQREADAIRQAARHEGQAAAVADAEQNCDLRLERSRAQMASIVRQAIDELAQAKAQWLAHWEKVAVHVAAAIAQRLVRRELRDSPEITLQLVREALELAAGSTDLQVRLNPADYETLKPQVESLTQELRVQGSARIVADPQVSQGGCKVDSRFGTIDQQIEAQLARIEHELS